MKTCWNCGATVPDTAKFCRECGAQLMEAQEQWNEPVIDPEDRTMIIPDEGEEPTVLETPYEEPVFEAPYEEPVQETPYETPVQETPYEEPVSETPYEEPAQEAPYQPAARGNAYEVARREQQYQQEQRREQQYQQEQRQEQQEWRQEQQEWRYRQEEPRKEQRAYSAQTPKWDHTAEFDPKDISDNKVIAMLVYLMGWIGIIIALLAGNQSPYAAFHVRQGLKFVALNALMVLVSILLCWTIIVPIAAGIFAVILFVVKIICFFSICRGNAKEPPIVRAFGFLR